MSPARYQHPLLADDVLHECLSGGCDLYVYRKRSLRRRHGLLTVDFGSVDVGSCEPAPSGSGGALHGLAHFLEHRLFVKASGDITDRFAALGAEVDAHTSLTTTGYSFTCIESFEACLGLLLELVLVPYFTEEAIGREREIITREIELYEDSVESLAFNAALRSLYPHHPLGVDIAGTRESLERIDREALLLAHRAAYCPSRLALFLSGDLDFGSCRECVSSLLEQYAELQQTASPSMPRPLADPAPRRMVARLSVAQPRLLLAFAPSARELRGVTLMRREICMELLCDILFGPAGAFYSRHYESGLIDDGSFGYEIHTEPSFTFAVVGGATPHPAELEEAITDEIATAAAGTMVADGLERAVRKAHGQLLCRYDEIEGCAAMVDAAARRNCAPFFRFEVLATITLEQVTACLASCLRTEAYGVSVVLPHTVSDQMARRPPGTRDRQPQGNR